MPKFEVYHDARITYKWHREIEAESAEDAIEKVQEIQTILLDESIDPYGRESDGRPFIEVDWDSNGWDVQLIDEPEDNVATSEDL